MTEYTTLRVTVDAKEQAEQSKTDDETWNDYILRCTDNPPEQVTVVDSDNINVSLDATERQQIVEEIARELQR